MIRSGFSAAIFLRSGLLRSPTSVTPLVLDAGRYAGRACSPPARVAPTGRTPSVIAESSPAVFRTTTRWGRFLTLTSPIAVPTVWLPEALAAGLAALPPSSELQAERVSARA